ncbi:hypothetical protein LCGC14_0624260 [marine sediment metagenome]|uniref:PseI/NeuA/B-like domain-containing protein n=1 Tax=marine sediment metagenome TaxID=412755 RepID=A0A0F9R3Z6_9ZZZZ
MPFPKIVADLGINHNGSLQIAKTMIAMAKNYGADYVKFQKRHPTLVYTPDYLSQRRIGPWGNTIGDEKRSLEFDHDGYAEIDSWCKQLGIEWFASPWSVEDVEFLARYNPPFMKVASVCMVHKKLLDAIRETGIPVVASTGLVQRHEIDEAVEVLANDDKLHYLLHCVGLYPCPDARMGMRRIDALRERYGDRAAIGFSNHSPRTTYLVQAAIMGAEMLECHITLDRNMSGVDQEASIGPAGFEELMTTLKAIWAGWGDGAIAPCDEEADKGGHYRWWKGSKQ